VAKFPVDAPARDVIRAFEHLGFSTVRERTILTIPNHRTLKRSTLRTILSQASIDRDEFLAVYHK